MEKLFGFKAKLTTDSRDLERHERFAVRLDFVGKRPPRVSMWLYETKEAAEEARRLAHIIGIEVLSDITEFNSGI